MYCDYAPNIITFESRFSDVLSLFILDIINKSIVYCKIRSFPCGGLYNGCCTFVIKSSKVNRYGAMFQLN